MRVTTTLTKARRNKSTKPLAKRQSAVVVAAVAVGDAGAATVRQRATIPPLSRLQLRTPHMA